MTAGSDFGYGFVDPSIERAGVEKRDVDAFEAMLALCRVMGLRYEIKVIEGYKAEDGIPRYSVNVSNKHWHCCFFAPTQMGVSSGVFGATKERIVWHLQQAICYAVSDLDRNAGAFASAFARDWNERTGQDWIQEGDPHS